jgi:hypothetical protein
MSNIKYSVYPSIRIEIEGCPKHGFEALDFRTKKGLPVDLTNRMVVKIGDVTEQEARALVAVGFRLEASGTLYAPPKLDHKLDPCDTAQWGHYATISVNKEDSPVTLAIRAVKACFVKQARAKIGADELEKERGELLARVEEIDAALASVYANP